MKTNSKRGDGGVTLIIALAVLGLLSWGASKTIPAFNGDARRAKEGQQTTTQLVEAANAPAAANTASAATIGRAAAALPDSPAATFIRAEVPIMLARGPAPDPKELLAAEKRLNAYLSGQLDEARRLNAAALKDASSLQRDLAEALAAKRAADEAITVAAAEKLAANRTSIGFGLLAAAAACLWLYTRSTSLPRIDLARMANRARESGADALGVIDAVVPDSWHGTINRMAANLRAKESAAKAARVAAAQP